LFALRTNANTAVRGSASSAACVQVERIADRRKIGSSPDKTGEEGERASRRLHGSNLQAFPEAVGRASRVWFVMAESLFGIPKIRDF
jgi:hypothetical protein